MRERILTAALWAFVPAALVSGSAALFLAWVSAESLPVDPTAPLLATAAASAWAAAWLIWVDWPNRSRWLHRQYWRRLLSYRSRAGSVSSRTCLCCGRAVMAYLPPPDIALTEVDEYDLLASEIGAGPRALHHEVLPYDLSILFAPTTGRNPTKSKSPDWDIGYVEEFRWSSDQRRDPLEPRAIRVRIRRLYAYGQVTLTLSGTLKTRVEWLPGDVPGAALLVSGLTDLVESAWRHWTIDEHLARRPPFSPREAEALNTKWEGLTAKEAARQMGISRKSVEDHLQGAAARVETSEARRSPREAMRLYVEWLRPACGAWVQRLAMTLRSSEQSDD